MIYAVSIREANPVAMKHCRVEKLFERHLVKEEKDNMIFAIFLNNKCNDRCEYEIPNWGMLPECLFRSLLSKIPRGRGPLLTFLWIC